MYLQITNKCNMECAHCMFECSPRKRSFMSMDVFCAAISAAAALNESVMLGGGEPTLHPDFREFVDLALHKSERGVSCVTNGKRTNDAFWMLELAEDSPNFYPELSLDRFHADVNIHVRNAYLNARCVRDSSNWKVILAGRAVTSRAAGVEECRCPDLFVDPQGRFWPCGCMKGAPALRIDAFSSADIVRYCYINNIRPGECYGHYRKG